MKKWWLDEHQHAGEEHLDPDYVAGYDRKAGFDPAEDVETLQCLGLDAGSVVVEAWIAGAVPDPVAVAPHCGRIVAVDVSPAMTAALNARIRDEKIPNATVVEAGFLSYDHAGEPADFAYSRNALHQLPDFWKAIALTRIFRLLRPGGILLRRDLVFDFEPHAADEAVEAWIAGAVPDPVAGFTADELAEHVRSEHSTYRWILEPILERAGFEILDRSFRRSAYGAYTCRRPEA